MFDPDSYFVNVQRELRACRSWIEVAETPPKIVISQGKVTFYHWRVMIKFENGSNLEALELHSRRAGLQYRKIRYRLEGPNKEMVFLVDTHGTSPLITDPLHAHIGPDKGPAVLDGDPALCGYPLRDYDFMKMWQLTKTYVQEGGLPWLKAGQ